MQLENLVQIVYDNEYNDDIGDCEKYHGVIVN